MPEMQSNRGGNWGGQGQSGGWDRDGGRGGNNNNDWDRGGRGGGGGNDWDRDNRGRGNDNDWNRGRGGGWDNDWNRGWDNDWWDWDRKGKKHKKRRYNYYPGNPAWWYPYWNQWVAPIVNPIMSWFQPYPYQTTYQPSVLYP